MRIAAVDDRLALLHGDLALDVERASDGRFGADPQAIYERWDEFAAWAEGARGGGGGGGGGGRGAVRVVERPGPAAAPGLRARPQLRRPRRRGRLRSAADAA